MAQNVLTITLQHERYRKITKKLWQLTENDLQFRISDMKTARPRIPSPRTGAISFPLTSYRASVNLFRALHWVCCKMQYPDGSFNRFKLATDRHWHTYTFTEFPRFPRTRTHTHSQGSMMNSSSDSNRGKDEKIAHTYTQLVGRDLNWKRINF